MPRNPENQFIDNKEFAARIRLQVFLGTYQYERAEEYYKNKKEYVNPIWYEEAVRNARQKEYNGLANIAISSVQSLLNDCEIEKAEEYYNKNAKYINAEFYKDAYRVAVQRRRQNEINAVKSELEKLVDSYRYHEAKDYYEQNKNHIDETWYEEICRFAREKQFEEKAKSVKSGLQKLLESYRFEDAKEYYQANKEYVDTKWYEDAYRNAEQRQLEEKIKAVKLELQELLKSYRFEDAKEYCQINKDYVDSAWYGKWKNHYYQKYKIEGLLQKHQYYEADKLYNQHSECFTKEEYISKKAEQIQIYAQTILNLDKQLDSQQSHALADISDNLLVTARAGSGKTTVLTCKTAFLINEYRIDPDKVLLLAFNKEAAREMQKRIVNDFRIDNFRNARTFHSLAYNLVKPNQRILYDQSDEDFAGDLSSFVKDVLRSIWNPAFRVTILRLFKKEIAEIKRRGDLLDDEDYYIFRRSVRDISLKGDRVKSAGEKYIADFLFEHDIKYTYEQGYLWNKNGIYRPDFTLHENQEDIVIEHWALDPEYSSATLPDHWTKTSYEYRAEMQRKKEFLRWQGIRLIETSVANLSGNGTDNVRDNFENMLKRKLEDCGIECKRLSDKEIADRVVKKQTSRMVRMFVQFIQKSKKKRWSSADVKAQVDKHTPLDQREEEFLKLAIRVYKEYEHKIEEQGKIDFDMLMEKSVGLIETTQGNCSISLGHNRDRQIRMSELEWILIDEYQDFSRQFQGLVNAIRQNNKELKLFCVGDDWQAINGFAGSDISYFDNFEENYLAAGRKNLLTNYRCDKAIVEAGNKLMRGCGQEAKFLPNRNEGLLEVLDITSKWIECDKNNEQEYRKDLKYRFYEELEDGRQRSSDNGELQAKYVKTMFEVATEPSNLGKEIAILSRTNNFYYLKDVKTIKQKLKFCFAHDNLLEKIGGPEGFDKLFKIGTVHSFKGLQADIVFILKACDGTFPLIHPDWALYRIFGESEKTILDEEKRLFYVALTRAKQKVYLLTEADDKSPFLSEI